MQFKEQLRKHSNWTITAMTAGAVTVVAATGLALADGGGGRGSLQDQINLQDQMPISQGQAFLASDDSATVIPAPIFEAGDSPNTFDSPLDVPGTSLQTNSVPSVISVASVQSVTSPVAFDSDGTPDASNPDPAQVSAYDDSLDSSSTDSFDSPS